MSDLTERSADVFTVLMNHEAQYSLWPAGKPVPEKWRLAGVSGAREECLAFVRREWTDTRPARVRAMHAGSESPVTAAFKP